VASVIWISPDNLLVLLTRRYESDGTVIFWKYVFSFAFQSIATTLFLGGPRQVAHHLWQAGRYSIGAPVIICALGIFLNLAFLNTTAVQAMLFFSLHILWAAVGGWLLLGDKLPIKTICMVVIGVGCAIVTFLEGRIQDGGSHGGGAHVDGSLANGLFGDIMGMAAGATFAAMCLTFRFFGKEKPGVSTLPMSCAGSFLCMLSSVVIADFDPTLAVPSKTLPIAVVNGLLVGGGLLGFALAPRWLTAAEVALICLLEPGLGPVFVYIGVGQKPSMFSVLIGIFFLACLAVHEALSFCEVPKDVKVKDVEQHGIDNFDDITGAEKQTDDMGTSPVGVSEARGQVGGHPQSRSALPSLCSCCFWG